MPPTLYDHRGLPIDFSALREEKAAPSVMGVRQIVTGHPAQGLTPPRLTAILRDAEQGDAIRYLELAEEMEEKDGHYLSVMGTRKRQVAQLKITVEAASDSAADAANAEPVEAFLDRDELEDETFDILDAVGKGFSATEIIWDVSEKQWMPLRLEWRFPQWFEFDYLDGMTLRRREPHTEDGGLVELEPFKFICHKVRAKSGLPIRGGLARVAAWGYLFKNFGIKDWVQFVETYAQPVRVGKYSPSALEEDKDALLRAVSNIAADAAAIIPESMMIEFVKDTSARSSSDIYERLCMYLDAQVSKAVLGQTLTTQEGTSGSYSLGQVHDEVRADIERADARQLAATLNRDLVRPIVDLNRGPQEAYPQIRIGREEETDVEELVGAVSKLVPFGFRVSQTELRAKIGLKDPDDDDELLAPPARPAAAPGSDPAQDPDGVPDEDKAAARAVRRSARTDDVDRIADRLARAAVPALDGLVDAVRGAVDAAEDFADLRDRVAAIAGRFGVLGFADLIAEALLVAELAGRDDILADAGEER